MDDFFSDIEDRPHPAKRYATEAILRKVSDLSVTEHHVLDAIFAARHDDLVRRLQVRGNALVVVDLPGKSWESRVLRMCEIAVSDLSASKRDFLCVDVEDSARRVHKTEKSAIETALSLVRNSDVVVCGWPGSEIDPSVRSFADLQVTVPALTPDHMKTALRRRFGQTQTTWPIDLDLASFELDVVDAAVRRSTRPEEAIVLLESVRKASPSSTSKVVPFSNMRGFGDAHAWGLQLIDDVSAYRAGDLSWTDVGAGALLVGPPGTGKTAFAASLAHALGVPFFPTSYATWQASRSGHLGDVTRAIRNTFTDASAKIPSLIFIDEIDVLQPRTTERSQDWWNSITSTLLEALDGIHRRDGVVVLAACNGVSPLDPALVRAGRLDRTFRIGLPSSGTIAAIVADGLDSSLSEVDIAEAFRGLEGTLSGADAVRIARDVRRLARSERREPNIADVRRIAIPADARPPALVRRICIHEAGHAVSLLARGVVPTGVSILERGDIGGGVAAPTVATETRLVDLEAETVDFLAGRAAEEILLGSVSAGAGGSRTSDLASATAIVTAIEARYGLGARLSYGSTASQDAVEARLRQLYAIALGNAVAYRATIASLAEILFRERVLGREALEHFAVQHGLLPAENGSPT